MADKTPELEAALTLVRAAGYVLLKTSSYRRAQERHRIALVRLEDAAEQRASTERWAHQAFTEQRRVGDRLTSVYGAARAHGATVAELDGF